jgi:RimJ/RimL family protein N-acetyltransferase
MTPLLDRTSPETSLRDPHARNGDAVPTARNSDGGLRPVTIERTRDYSLLWQIVMSDSIYRITSDDFSPAPRNWKLVESEECIYLLARQGEKVLGFCAFHPVNGVTFAAHLCFLSRGPANQDAFRLMLAWMWRSTRATRIVGSIPDYNRSAIKFCERAGCQIFGINPQSWMKDGRLRDLILLGISRPNL